MSVQHTSTAPPDSPNTTTPHPQATAQLPRWLASLLAVWSLFLRVLHLATSSSPPGLPPPRNIALSFLPNVHHFSIVLLRNFFPLLSGHVPAVCADRRLRGGGLLRLQLLRLARPPGGGRVRGRHCADGKPRVRGIMTRGHRRGTQGSAGGQAPKLRGQAGAPGVTIVSLADGPVPRARPAGVPLLWAAAALLARVGRGVDGSWGRVGGHTEGGIIGDTCTGVSQGRGGAHVVGSYDGAGGLI